MLLMKWCGTLLLASLLLLQGCQSLPQSQQLRQSPLLHLSTSKLIEDVPFYPQQEFYCGPTVLAEVLNFNGHQSTPEKIAPQLFIPGREGSLQLEMVSAARSHGMLAYASRSNLAEVLHLIDNNVPVIVLQNLATSWFPMWHYAVVIGYDQQHQQIILHTGLTANHSMSYELFERVWQRGNYWMLALLKPQQEYAFLEPLTYIRAAYDLLSLGHEDIGLAHLKSATTVWPTQWLSYFLLGNHYLSHSSQAISWFEKGYALAKDNPQYLNNFSYALAQNGCVSKAKTLINRALSLAPQDQNLRDSLAEITAMNTSEQTQLPAHCANVVI